MTPASRRFRAAASAAARALAGEERWQAARDRLWRFRLSPPVGFVRWGSLRRLEPISSRWGFERGTPIDRYYIGRFLERHADDIAGAVLEVANDTYTSSLGRGVTSSDILHVEPGDPRATLTGDLAEGSNLPSERFDCAVVTQTLHLIPDTRAAVATLNRMLVPGGVLLATIPVITKVSRFDMDRWGDFWRMTTRAARLLFEDAFDGDTVVEARGNVLTATAFLYGIAAEELGRAQLDHNDPDFEVLLTVRAVKRRSPGP